MRYEYGELLLYGHWSAKSDKTRVLLLQDDFYTSLF